MRPKINTRMTCHGADNFYIEVDEHEGDHSQWSTLSIGCYEGDLGTFVMFLHGMTKREVAKRLHALALELLFSDDMASIQLSNDVTETQEVF